MRRFLLVLGIAFALSCGGDPGVDPRLSTVHHTYAAIGMVQTGAIAEGSLRAGGEVRHRRDLDAHRCYQLLALGEGIGGMELLVRDPEGRPLRRRSSADAQVALRVCPEEAGEHDVILRAAQGEGTYSLTTWETETGSCGSPLPLSLADAMELEQGDRRWVVEGSTEGADALLAGTCIGDTAPEQVYVLEVREPSRLRASLVSEYDGGLYLSSACGNPQQEIACNDDAGDVRHSRVVAAVEPGQYYLVVDGFGSGSGDYRLDIDTVPAEAVVAACDQARRLPSEASSLPDSTHDYFDSDCNPNGGAETVYAVHVAERSRVRVSRTGGGVGAIYFRTGCEPEAAEITCGIHRASAVLDPGTHYVVVEGRGGGVEASAEVLQRGDGACAGAPVQDLPLDGRVSGDTRGYENRLGASCGGHALSGEMVYRLHIENATTVRLLLMSEHDAVLHLRTDCGDDASEILCADDTVDNHHALAVRTLAPGDYFVVVDGFGEDSEGRFVLETTSSPAGALPTSAAAPPAP